MARAKTYWDEIKDDETHFYGGSMGWEVHLRWVEYWDYSRSNEGLGEPVLKRKLELQWPWGYSGQEKLPKGEKKRARKEVMLVKKLRKLLAQASSNRSEYNELRARTSDLTDEDWQEIFDMGMKRSDLSSYIQRNYLTDGEAHSLFWRM